MSIKGMELEDKALAILQACQEIGNRKQETDIVSENYVTKFGKSEELHVA